MVQGIPEQDIFYEEVAMRKIFIDCGAWNGFSTRFFLDNHPLSAEFDIYAFECNDKIDIDFGGASNVNLIPKAVWTQDGTIEMYLGSGKYTESSSLIKDKRTGHLDKENPEILPCIDFSSWLSKNVTKNDLVLLKMNIEGAEYEVLKKMHADVTLPLVDRVYIQWHWKKINMTKPNHDKVARLLKGIPTYSWNLEHDGGCQIIGEFPNEFAKSIAKDA